MVSRLPRPFTSMLPPSSTKGLPRRSAGRKARPVASAIRRPTSRSSSKSGYFAHALNGSRQSPRRRPAPGGRRSARSPGPRCGWWGCGRTARRRTMPRPPSAPGAPDLGRGGVHQDPDLLVRQRASARSRRTPTGSAANFPGQSARLCGQAIHVAAWGSHSAGMRHRGSRSSFRR